MAQGSLQKRGLVHECRKTVEVTCDFVSMCHANSDKVSEQSKKNGWGTDPGPRTTGEWLLLSEEEDAVLKISTCAD